GVINARPSAEWRCDGSCRHGRVACSREGRAEGARERRPWRLPRHQGRRLSIVLWGTVRLTSGEPAVDQQPAGPDEEREAVLEGEVVHVVLPGDALDAVD